MSEYIQRILDGVVHGGLLDARPNTGFYPSSASIRVPDSVFGTSAVGGCLRQTWYKWFRFPESREESANSLARLHLGNWTHDGFGALLRRITAHTNLVVVREEHAFWKPEMKMSGRSDILCYDLSKKKYVILELKSVNAEHGPNGYIKVFGSPKPEHILQCIPYIHVYQDIQPDIEAVILYVNMMSNFRVPFLGGATVSTGRHLESPARVTCPEGQFTLAHYTMHNIRERWTELEGYIKNRTLPPPDYFPVYNEQQAIGLYDTGRFRYKAEAEAVKKWMELGAIPGQLTLPYTPGDQQCSWCPFKSFCQGNIDSAPVECPTKTAVKKFQTDNFFEVSYD